MTTIYLFLVLVVSFTSGSLTQLTDVPPREWIVNLDLPPEQRWPWQAMLPYYLTAVQEAQNLIGKFIPKYYQPIVEDLAADLLPYLGEYAGEITSGAKLCNISIGRAVLLNLIYEAQAACTSIIAQTETGHILHARNLDFPLTSVLRKLTIQVDFRSKGKTLYKGTTYVGYVGLLTGMRLNAFSISANERDLGDYLIDNILQAMFIPGTTSASFLIRDTLASINNFKEAVLALSNTPLAAPIYFIVAGVTEGEGAVISRDRDGAANVWFLDVPNQARWFEVETNDDHWEPPTDTRRATANIAMQKVGWTNISLRAMYDVLSTPPVLNQQTTYTTTMSPALGNFTTLIRTYPN